MKNIFPLALLFFVNLNLVFSQITEITLLDFPFDTFRKIDELNNSTSAEAYPWISNDGLRIYYTSSSGGDKFVMSERVHIDSSFSAPRTLSISLNTTNNNSAWLTNDELSIYYAVREPNGDLSSRLYFARRADKADTFDTPIPITLEGDISGSLNGPSLTQNLDQIFITNSALETKVLVFDRIETDRYQLVDSLDLPTGLTPQPGRLGDHDLSYYLSFEDSNDDVSLHVYKRTDTASKFDSLFFLDNSIINNSLRNLQPHLSNDGNFLVSVRNDEDVWSANDLCIAYREIPPSSLSELMDDNIFVSAYPNPASSQIKFEIAAVENSKSVFSVYSNIGALIHSEIFEIKDAIYLDLSDYDQGLYFYEFKFQEANNTTGSFVVKRN